MFLYGMCLNAVEEQTQLKFLLVMRKLMVKLKINHLIKDEESNHVEYVNDTVRGQTSGFNNMLRATAEKLGR